MDVVERIDERGGTGGLDRLDVLHGTQRRAEAEVLPSAVQLAGGQSLTECRSSHVPDGHDRSQVASDSPPGA